MVKRRSTTTPPKVPPVGSRVRMRFGVADVIATVTEHRGPLGVGGRQVIGVKFYFTHVEEPFETEVDVDQVTPVRGGA